MNDVRASSPDADELYALVRELFPICRSITGDGVRETLARLSRVMPLETVEVPSGTKVLDWTVPDEWNIRDAYVKNMAGERVVDFHRSNLHVVNYSVPVNQRMTLEQLRPHLHTLPDQPEAIPYRTSYYSKAWGFCLSHARLSELPEGEYEVCIDSSLRPGALTYGELVLPGATTDEVLISTHVCHPSLCDDNLSGLTISIHLARALAQLTQRRYTYRFLYAPGTIGAIAWLEKNRETAKNIKHGLTLTCLGDSLPFTYKRTVAGKASIDRVLELVLKRSGHPFEIIDFFPYGYDERQYNSPGFRLPVGSLMRGRHGRFPEYHTSGDNLEFVTGEQLLASYRVLRTVVDVLEHNRTFRNLVPWGEPQLGSRGLYRAMGGNDVPDLQFAMLWMLNLSDGEHSVLDIAERSNVDVDVLALAARLLEQHALLTEITTNT